MPSFTVLNAAPAVEPLSVAAARRHLRLDAQYGEPAPGAPTVALASPAAVGNVDDGAHRYRVTFVTADGETEGGTISDAVTVADKTVNGKVELTGIPLGGAAVTSRKIYRTEAGGSDYLLLATIADNTTTAYTDNIADSSLGAAAPTTNGTEDPELVSMIQAARESVEKLCGRSLITQTWDLWLDSWPASGVIKLPRPPVQSVTSVVYYDTDDTEATFAASNYLVDTAAFPGRLILNSGASWPTTSLRPLKSVRVRYVTGYGDAAGDVEANDVALMKLLLGHMYANREAVVVGTITAEMPLSVRQLVWQNRVMP